MAVCAALAEEVRVKMILLLLDQKMCVSEISESLNISIANASHHLIILKRVKILMSKKQGKENYYQIDPNGYRCVKKMILETLF